MTKLEKVLYTAKAHTTGGRDGGASRMPKADINSRRRFLHNAAMTLGAIGSASAQSRRKLSPVALGTNTSFGSLKRIDAGLLNVGYAEAGPANGPAVILLHGWPYDIHSYVDVATML